ncbi:MAG: uroporphyrinogen decarboxylase family protein [Verrucomicrobiota bacterium]
MFQPDYNYFSEVMYNRRPQRMPLYEHTVSAEIMEKILDADFAELEQGSGSDLTEYFRQHCRFFQKMTYDTVSYEVRISDILPGPIALTGGKGPIQTREEFDSYPWREIPVLYWQQATPRFDALRAALPEGMKAVGGVGNGVFELAEALVGLEYLPFIQIDDPELYTSIFNAIGEMMATIWQKFMRDYGDIFVAGRFGDDLGFKSSLLTNPITVRDNILPQYRQIIDIVHANGGLFLWHSCGCIFEVMEDVIALGIDAKHSNEDAVAPFDKWIELYGDRIGLLGGFDMDFLCLKSETEIYEAVLEQGQHFRATANGYALGSGNSIPEYVPVENYLAMVKAGQEIRRREVGMEG